MTRSDYDDMVAPEVSLVPTNIDDQAGLRAIGKEAAFKRRFSFWTALAMTVCVSGTWEGISAVLLQALAVGGPVGLLYGYILTALCMICVAASLGELSSIWPSSGAQYHWTAELAPLRFRTALSWISGWLVIGYLWLATVSCAMGVAVQVQAYVSIANSGYAEVAQRWHVYVIYVTVCIIYLVFNIYGMKLLHFLNTIGMVFHVLGYIATLVVLLTMTKNKHDSDFVFKTFINNSGWSSNGVAFCVGILSSLYGFGGIDSAIHFAEEIKNVRRSLPRAIFWTVVVNAVTCLPWIITLLYCLGDIDALLANPISFSSPSAVIYLNTTGSAVAAVILSLLSSYLAFIGGADVLGASSRAVWAMARDNAFPEVFKRLHPTLNIPIYCIFVCWVPQVLIGMIYIWNQTAFYGIISGVLALYTLSFFLPIALHAMHARRRQTIQYGPWTLGRLSMPLNMVAMCWSIFIFIFLCFPVYMPVSASNMNYAIAIIATLVIIAAVSYIAYGRKKFNGPIVETTEGINMLGMVRTDSPTGNGHDEKSRSAELYKTILNVDSS